MIQEEKPIAVQKFYPIGIMIQETPEQKTEEEKTSSAGKWILAMIIIAGMWYITIGWEMFK